MNYAKMGYRDILSFCLKTRSKEKCMKLFNSWIKSFYKRHCKCLLKKKRPTYEDFARIQYSNLGYFIGYYGDEDRKKLYARLDVYHPIFGRS